MSNDPAVPQVPEPKPEDPEDVSWALSTADAMWARGDHAEGIKWVRRAAEAASEAENDGRALELAKAAADLAAMISRMTRVSIDLEELEPEPAAAPPPVPPVRPAAGRPPAPKPSAAPRAMPGSVTKQVVTPSRPPAPLPSRTSQPPPAMARVSQPPPSKAKPLGTNTKPASLRPGAMKDSSAPRPEVKPESSARPREAKEAKEAKEARKAARRSRENIEPAAPAQPSPSPSIADTASHPVLDPHAIPLPGGVPGGETVEIVKAPQPDPPPRRDANNEPTMVGVVPEVRAASVPDWDADADWTRSLTGDDFGDTSVRPVPPMEIRQQIEEAVRAAESQQSPPATVAASRLAPAPAPAPAPVNVAKRHDPAIVTSQAVRVVVWRDASGVHVAPAGTVVSAITVDAVLVALEPNADLTAWLTQNKR